MRKATLMVCLARCADLLREGDGSEGTSGSDEEGSGQEELALPSTR